MAKDWHNEPGTRLPGGKIDNRAKGEFKLYVYVLDEQGRTITLPAHYMGFDHIPGGHLFVPEVAMDAVSLEIRADGRITHIDND